jgi:glycosyl transferase, family 25
MKIYCINLDRFQARFQRLEALLEGSGLSLIRVSALDGQRLRERLVPAKPRPGALDGKGTLLTRFEIGAVLSHRKAWRAFLRSNDSHALFIEDDVYFGNHFARYLQSSVFETTPYDIINLETTNAPVVLKRGTPLPFDERRIYEIATYHHGAGGYILTRDAARRLLTLSAGAPDGIDTIIFNMARHKESRLPLFKQAQVSPALIVQHVCHPNPPDEPLLNSYIADRRGPRIERTKLSLAKIAKEILRPFRKLWFKFRYVRVPFL